MMSESAEQVKGALIDAVVDLAERRYRGDDPDESDRVMRLYYERIPHQDLADRSPLGLYASAVRHLELAQRRQQAETLVSVYNPRVEVDGWSSSHTVIDVVVEDMPFIVDSLLAVLERLGLQVHLLAHPMAAIERDADGELTRIDCPEDSTANESLVHIEVDRVANDGGVADLQFEISSVLADVRAAVEDWIPMRTRAERLADELEGLIAEYEAGTTRFECTVGTEPDEVATFLRWLAEGYFTFIGYREYDFLDDASGVRIVSRPETGLGILRTDEASSRDLTQLPPEILAAARRPTLINLTKANSDSTVHRAVPLDYVGIKEIDETGTVVGERRFVGLLTSTVYTGRVLDLPIVRRRVKSVLDETRFHPGSHDRSRLLNLLQTYPRDELLQCEAETVSRMVREMLDLRDRRKVSLLYRRDQFGRFLSCMIFVPRDRYNTDVRLTISDIMMEVYRGTSCRFSTEISDDPLARLQLVIYTDLDNELPHPDRDAVQARLSRVIRSWDDDLRAAIVEANGEDVGLGQFARYQKVLTDSYRNDVTPAAAVFDLAKLEELEPDSVDTWLSRPLEARDGELRCKVYRRGSPMTLSQILPVLHDLGAEVTDERPYEFDLPGAGRYYIYDLGLRFDGPVNGPDRQRFREAMLAATRGHTDSDELAKLVASAGLNWREVAILRAYTRYFNQLGGRFSASYVRDTLNHNLDVARGLVALFNTRFDPSHAAREVEGHAEEVREWLMADIDKVPALDADRILRALASLVEATVRTNAWQIIDQPDRALAFKFDPGAIIDLPRPVPAAEIFVSHPRIEGVHLRAGAVARGGLRWSDRMEDFRTEVLGLMKAQSVKNSVIVPVGAKGGFVARHLPDGDRDAVQAEVVACYRMFIGALLDVTDNLDGEVVVPPPDLVRLDGDDPYLVVAADKGTATFSDIANSIAEERGFWLQDAFASGGSAGYDHKALGITARGAWRSVEAHFRRLGLDPATQEFTAVGIGDMSGDVFGNGMLQTDRVRLVAAFDHRHVFLDPTPDPASSFAERQRLYDLPRSTWADYDPGLLSPGGGVHARTLKSIPITGEVRSALGLSDETTDLAPNELIKAILCAPVDLLWNGGIGTYVKATSQTDTEVGDRANDAVRVDGRDLRCAVVGEGGNLGFTQRARIEFARAGGRINTDAIDNSAGVDCSDHEVNIKILLASAVAEGDLTRKQRDVLMGSMVDDVCDLVLENNVIQNEALDTAEVQAPGMIDVHQRLMAWLTERAGLDRDLEALPSDAELALRSNQGEGLSRPELAVVMAYIKNLVAEELVASDLPDEPYLRERLFDYFPPALQDGFPELIDHHPLRRELIAMLVANDLVNRGGISMTHRLATETSAALSDLARAHEAGRRIYGLDTISSRIRAERGIAPASVVTAMEQEVKRLGERATRWLLRNEAQPIDISTVIDHYRPLVAVLDSTEAAGVLDDGDMRTRLERFDGASEELARVVSMLGPAYGFLDLSHVAGRTGADLADVAAVHRVLDQRLDLSWLRDRITALPRTDHWETLARSALRDEFFREHAELTATVVSQSNGELGREGPSAAVEHWAEQHRVAVDRCRRTFDAISGDATQSLARVSVAVQAMTQLGRTT